MALHIRHVDGDPTNNDPANLRLVEPAARARKRGCFRTAPGLTPGEHATLGRLLRRRGLLAVTMALADLTTMEELNAQAAKLRGG